MKTNMISASDLVGASPLFDARPVSIAVRDYIAARQEQVDKSATVGLLVAVSGGADSLALVVAAADCASRMGVPLIARVVDHAMRDGSAEEAANVVATLKGLGINARVLPVKTEEVPGGVALGEGPEGAARQLRHGVLETEAYAWGEQQGLNQVDILFGHTMDDQAETMMLRLARGASPDSMTAMRPFLALNPPVGHERGVSVQVNRGRPLLSLRRRNTEAFCSVLNLFPVQDPTNRADGPWRTRSGKALPRSAVRERVLPALREALGQDPTPGLARLSDLLAQDQEALEAYAEQALVAAMVEATESSVVLDTAALQKHPRATRIRALRGAVARLGERNSSAVQMDELERSLWQEKNAEGNPRTVVLTGHVKAVREGPLLVVEAVPR